MSAIAAKVRSAKKRRTQEPSVCAQSRRLSAAGRVRDCAKWSLTQIATRRLEPSSQSSTSTCPRPLRHLRLLHRFHLLHRLHLLHRHPRHTATVTADACATARTSEILTCATTTQIAVPTKQRVTPKGLRDARSAAPIRTRISSASRHCSSPKTLTRALETLAHRQTLVVTQITETAGASATATT